MSELWNLLADHWLRFVLVGTGGLVVTALVVAAVARVFIAAEKASTGGESRSPTRGAGEACE